jgi:uncharacterized UPF0160 family protein
MHISNISKRTRKTTTKRARGQHINRRLAEGKFYFDKIGRHDISYNFEGIVKKFNSMEKIVPCSPQDMETLLTPLTKSMRLVLPSNDNGIQMKLLESKDFLTYGDLINCMDKNMKNVELGDSNWYQGFNYRISSTGLGVFVISLGS